MLMQYAHLQVRTDLLLVNGDLPIDTPGLMPVGFSDEQHQVDAFNAMPGEWKQFIFNGIGVLRYLKSNSGNNQELNKQSRIALQRDGYNVGVIKITYDDTGKMHINTNSQL